jgi:pyruvate,water dikinase
MEQLVCTLAEIDARHLSLVGGKGANLGELTAAGIPVPAAFIVTTNAYRQFISKSGIAENILQLLLEVDHEDPATIEDIGIRIRTLFDNAETPQEIAADIKKQYLALCAGTAEISTYMIASGQNGRFIPCDI